MSGQEIAPSKLRVASLTDRAKAACKDISGENAHITVVQTFICIYGIATRVGFSIVEVRRD
jgi:hypothetical protein